MSRLKEDALKIISDSVASVLPESAVKNALATKKIEGDKLYLVAIGKAAWRMANAASELFQERLEQGIVLTKYDHSKGNISKCEIIEAGHPVPDENSIKGGKKIVELISKITKDDTLIFLVSGGGSSLFEVPLPGIELSDIMTITESLLASGASINEMNSIRKHLSAVKGGRLAKMCKSQVFSVVLSDVVGDKLDMIASGPMYPDSTTSSDAIRILEKYNIDVSETILSAIKIETPKEIDNVESIISGNVSTLCESAARCAKQLGYEPIVLTTALECEAKEAGKFLGDIAKEMKAGSNSLFVSQRPCAVIVGGETVVKLTGTGKGGRNQELALSAALKIEGLKNVVVVSIGSDGTDGPTDAAGGIVDGETAIKIRQNGKNVESELNNNNSYYALKESDALLITGPTGTNVNDLMMILSS